MTKLMFELADTDEGKETALAAVNIIKPALKDILSEKLRNMRIDKMTAKEYEAVKLTKKNFVSSFLKLCWLWEGLSIAQIAALLKEDEGYMQELSRVVYERARKKVLFLRTISCFTLIGIPFVIFFSKNPQMDNGCRESEAAQYYACRKILKQKYGENYFPAEELEILIKEWRDNPGISRRYNP